MKRTVIVIASAFVLIAAFALALLLVEGRQAGGVQTAAQTNASRLIRDDAPTAGFTDARVTIVEFFDPACGTCRVFHPFVKGIVRDNPGKVRLVVRYLPLHSGSEDAVKILEAARLQGRFWETLEAAYATQGQWAINHQVYPELFWRSVSSVGLDPEQVSADMQSPAVLRNIQQDIEDARALGVSKTPGFFVNGEPLIEFGQAQLLELVNEAVAREYGR